jgi:hypothetical protein
VFTIQPELRLLRVTSEDLADSPRGFEDVLKEIRKKKNPKKTVKLSHVRSPVHGICNSIMSRYNEETAHVLGDTKSQARRRSQQMVVPERLFRHMDSIS